MRLLGIDGIRVLLGAIPFSERTEYHSVHSVEQNKRNTVYSEYTEYAFF